MFIAFAFLCFSSKQTHTHPPKKKKKKRGDMSSNGSPQKSVLQQLRDFSSKAVDNTDDVQIIDTRPAPHAASSINSSNLRLQQKKEIREKRERSDDGPRPTINRSETTDQIELPCNSSSPGYSMPTLEQMPQVTRNVTHQIEVDLSKGNYFTVSHNNGVLKFSFFL